MARGLTIKIRTAWWLMPYLWAVKWFYVLTGKEPDWDALVSVVLKGVKLKMEDA